MIAALNEPGKYPGSAGTRNLHDNLSDLRAQVAANQKGINLVQELMDEYSLPVVQAYMAHIQVLLLVVPATKLCVLCSFKVSGVLLRWHHVVVAFWH